MKIVSKMIMFTALALSMTNVMPIFPRDCRGLGSDPIMQAAIDKANLTTSTFWLGVFSVGCGLGWLYKKNQTKNLTRELLRELDEKKKLAKGKTIATNRTLQSLMFAGMVGGAAAAAFGVYSLVNWK